MNGIQIGTEDISSIISLVVGILYIIQIGFLKKGNKKSKQFFTYYLINLTLIILLFFLIDIGYTSLVKYLVPLITSSILLISPLLWIYIKNLVQPNDDSSIRKHILPSISIGVILLILEISIFLFKDKSIQEMIVQVMTFITLSSITVFFILQSIYYIYISYKLYNMHQQRVGNYFSYSENVDLKWIKILIVGFVVFIIGLVIVNLMKGELSDVLFDVLMIVYIAYIGINALNQKEIFPIETQSTKSENEIVASNQNKLQDDVDTNDSEERVEIIPELFSQLKTELIKKVNDDKIYRDQDLTIYKLAKEIGTNSKYLSSIINKEFEKNFVNFINEYRVEDAKQNLKSEKYKNYTIEAHGQHVGFKSKSSFNIAFKKYTGKTPTEFIKS
jgi:AraC-like DNA-binding protein